VFWIGLDPNDTLPSRDLSALEEALGSPCKVEGYNFNNDSSRLKRMMDKAGAYDVVIDVDSQTMLLLLVLKLRPIRVVRDGEHVRFQRAKPIELVFENL
jgi:hypothetical protein